MNKRYSISSIIGIIIGICIFLITYDESPRVIVLLIVIICLIVWSIRLLFLPKCKAVEIIRDRIIIYEYSKKHNHKIKYDIKAGDISRYYIGSRGGGKSRTNILVIYVDKKRITLSPFVSYMKNSGLINYDVRKIKKILDYQRSILN
jgi:hypothetical protein